MARHFGIARLDPILQLRQASIAPQFWNRYSYSANNPLAFTDPTGRFVNYLSLEDDDLELLLAELSDIAGLQLEKNAETGNLAIIGTLTDESGKPLGSATARADLTSAIENTERTFYAISRNNNADIFAQRRGVLLELDFVEIATAVATGDNASQTFNAGIIFLHELNHGLGLRDPSARMLERIPGLAGETVMHMNQIRTQLALPHRVQYQTLRDRNGRAYLPFGDGPVYVPESVNP